MCGCWARVGTEMRSTRHDGDDYFGEDGDGCCACRAARNTALPKLWARTWAALNLLSFVISFEFWATLPFLYHRTVLLGGDTAEHWGWVGASYALARLAGSCFFGRLALRVGAKSPILLAIFVACVGEFLFYLQLPASWNIILSRALVGFASGSSTSAIWHISRTTALEDRVNVVGNWYIFDLLGMILGPTYSALSVAVYESLPQGIPSKYGAVSMLSVSALNISAVASFILYLVCAICIWLSFRGVNPMMCLKDFVSDAEAPAIADGATRDGGESAGDVPGSHFHKRSSQCLPLGIYVVNISQLSYSIVLTAFQYMLVPYCIQQLGLTLWVPCALLAGMGVSIMLAALLEGILSHACGIHERCLVVLGMIVVLVGCVLSFQYHRLDIQSRIVMGIVSSLLLALGYGVIDCAQPTLYVRIISSRYNESLMKNAEKLMAILATTSKCGKIVGPLVTGYAIGSFDEKESGVTVVVGFMAAVSIIAMIWFVLSWPHLREPQRLFRFLSSAASQSTHSSKWSRENLLKSRTDSSLHGLLFSLSMRDQGMTNMITSSSNST